MMSEEDMYLIDVAMKSLKDEKMSNVSKEELNKVLEIFRGIVPTGHIEYVFMMGYSCGIFDEKNTEK
jgi:hypothetical protein